MSDAEKPQEDPPRLSFWQTLWSTAAAAFGVQTEDARQRDFSHGSPANFILAGLVFTVIFVVALVLIVKLVLSNVG